MMRRLMTMGIMLLMLSSCYYFNQVVDDIRDSNAMERGRKKDGGGAYKNDKYKEGVYKAIDDIAKRPVNKKGLFVKSGGVKSSITLRDSKLNKLFKVVGVY